MECPFLYAPYDSSDINPLAKSTEEMTGNENNNQTVSYTDNSKGVSQ